MPERLLDDDRIGKQGAIDKLCNFVTDCFGAKIITNNKPHVEYPWEYSSSKTFNEGETENGVKL
jgi:hypothetical protein